MDDGIGKQRRPGSGGSFVPTERPSRRRLEREGERRRRRQAAPEPAPEALAALKALLPAADEDLVARLAKFAAATDVPGAVVLVGMTFGPQLVARRYVADIVVRAGEPLVVASVRQLQEAVAAWRG